MSTKIAVIGSHEFIGRLKTVASKITEIEIDPYFYHKPQDAPELIRTMKPCDVIFFSGALPYYFSIKERELLHIPSLYFATDELAIASSLLSIINTNKISPERISIDIIDSTVVSNVFAEMDLTPNPIQVLDYRQMVEIDFDLAPIVNFHLNLWKQGTVDLALTSIHAVYDRLQALGVPSVRINDPQVSLIRGLQDAKNQAEFHKSKASQVAVGYVSANIVQEEAEPFAHTINATFQKLDENLVTFYSTRGDIEALMEQDFLADFFKNKGPVMVGFGYGATTTDADRNAKVALRFAEKEEVDSCVYILTEEKELLRPFPHTRKHHRLKNNDPELFEVAKQTKLSPANLSKLIEFSKSRQTVQFTAADLADYLQVTRRSTERILKKLGDHGYVKIVGEEMTYQQGRPRAIYQLELPVHL